MQRGKGTSIQEGGDRWNTKIRTIEYMQWLEAIKECGVSSNMGDVFNEQKILSIPESELTGRIKTPPPIGPAV